MDNNIWAILVGLLVACFTIMIVTKHKEPVSVCWAYIKDGQGNTHVMPGVQSNE